eukprot:3570589-Rhodomonas_salina.1
MGERLQSRTNFGASVTPETRLLLLQWYNAAGCLIVPIRYCHRVALPATTTVLTRTYKNEYPCSKAGSPKLSHALPRTTLCCGSGLAPCSSCLYCPGAFHPSQSFRCPQRVAIEWTPSPTACGPSGSRVFQPHPDG